MTAILLLIALPCLLTLLVRYARNDVLSTRHTPWPDDLVRP